MATAVQRGNVNQVPAMRRAEAPEPVAQREGVAAWGYLVRPALMPTVFSTSSALESEACEEVAARKV